MDPDMEPKHDEYDKEKKFIISLLYKTAKFYFNFTRPEQEV